MSDPGRAVATPLETMEAGDSAAPDWPSQLAGRLTEVATRTACEIIVVGLPRSLSGRDTASTSSAREVGAALERSGWRVEFWDERLSSAEAERMLLAAGRSRQERRVGRDRVAATLILQGWLDARARGGA